MARLLSIRIASWWLLLGTAVSGRAVQVSIQKYTTADGLPRDRIHCIVQDSLGYLWICTAEGLSRFDGYQFTNYTTTEGLAGNNVADFLAGRDGSYWVASIGGLCRFRPASRSTPKFQRYWLGGGREGEAANVLAEDRSGCGVVTFNGGFRLEPGKPSFAPIDIGLPRHAGDASFVASLQEDRNGGL